MYGLETEAPISWMFAISMWVGQPWMYTGCVDPAGRVDRMNVSAVEFWTGQAKGSRARRRNNGSQERLRWVQLTHFAICI